MKIKSSHKSIIICFLFVFYVSVGAYDVTFNSKVGVSGANGSGIFGHWVKVDLYEWEYQFLRTINEDIYHTTLATREFLYVGGGAGTSSNASYKYVESKPTFSGTNPGIKYTISDTDFNAGPVYLRYDNAGYSVNPIAYRESNIPMNVTRTLAIPYSVPDGVYYIGVEWKVGDHDGLLSDRPRFHSTKNMISITTIPEVNVEDIDFGVVPFGMGGGIVTKKANITMNGRGGRNVSLSLSSPQINLVKNGGSDTIPVSLLIKLTESSLDSSGKGSAYLEAAINTSQEKPNGRYIGTVEITIEYN